MNILLSKLNFDAPWAYPYLSSVLRPHHRVVVLPFSFWDEEIYSNDTWEHVYQPGGKYYTEITRGFSSYGIAPSQFTFINYFSDDQNSFDRALNFSDILFLTGGAPDLTMQRINKKGFAPAICSYSGIVIGCSAGAMVQCGCFHITPNRLYPRFYHEQGLGLLPACYGVEVHYVPDDRHNESVARTVRETERKILLLDNESGAVFQNQQWKLLGNAKFYPL